jgi:hypothetical protein
VWASVAVAESDAGSASGSRSAQYEFPELASEPAHLAGDAAACQSVWALELGSRLAHPVAVAAACWSKAALVSELAPSAAE